MSNHCNNLCSLLKMSLDIITILFLYIAITAKMVYCIVSFINTTGLNANLEKKTFYPIPTYNNVGSIHSFTPVIIISQGR